MYRKIRSWWDGDRQPDKQSSIQSILMYRKDQVLPEEESVERSSVQADVPPENCIPMKSQGRIWSHHKRVRQRRGDCLRH
jgi:hypothetical protein